MNILFLLIIFLCTACKSESHAPHAELPQTPVFANKAKISTVPLLIEARGSLLPSSRYFVMPQVEGVLQQVLVKEGQWVEKGDSLFIIESQPFELALQQTKAALEQAKARFEAIKKKRDRFEALNKKELLSKNEWEAILQEFRHAKAEVLLAAAKRDEAKLKIAHATIVAKQAGRVGKIDVFPGHYVCTMMDKPLCEIVTLDPVVVEFFVTENEFRKISDVKEVVVQPLSSKDISVKGKLVFVDNHFDPASGQIIMRASVENRDLKLRPGMCVHAQIAVGSLENVLVVPHKAVKYNQFGAFVMVVGKEACAEMRQVTIGPECEDGIVLHDGITAEDVVISDGLERVSIGTKVDVRI